MKNLSEGRNFSLVQEVVSRRQPQESHRAISGADVRKVLGDPIKGTGLRVMERAGQAFRKK